MAEASDFLKPFEGETAIHLLQANKDGTTQDTEIDLSIPLREGDPGILVGPLNVRPDVDFGMMHHLDQMEVIAWFLFVALLFAIGVNVVWRMWSGKIDLQFLISEKDGKASLSRFQALVFTFAFMIGIMMIIVRTGQFPSDIPITTLLILAGSLGTYLTSKYIQTGRDTVRGNAAAIGPQLRIGKPDGAQPGDQINITWEQAKSLMSGPSKYTIRTSPSGVERYSVVAVAIGETDLTIRATTADDKALAGSIRYCDGKGDLQTKSFTDQVTVKTPAGRISEVAVAFNSAETETVVIAEVLPG